MNERIRVLELFAGIGACSKALSNIGIEHEIVDAVEIDSYAVKSFNAIHGTNFVPQDITKWDKDVKVDLIMHGSPCQDFSMAGKQAGGDAGSGTRSSLMYETLRIVEKLRPKYVVWENVRNLLGPKHRHNFGAYLTKMRELGYVSAFRVLNAKDFGIPQSRERVFTVSVLIPEHANDFSNDLHSLGVFDFPEPFPLEKRLKDVLDDEVEDRFYLTPERLKKIKVWEERQIENGRGFRFNALSKDDVAKTVTTTADRPAGANYVMEPMIVDPQGRVNKVHTLRDTCPTLRAQTHGNPPCVMQVAQMYGFSKEPNPQAGRVYDERGLSPTLDTMSGGNRMPKVLDAYSDGTRVRKLTPLECWRLMGFDDEDYKKAASTGNSETQLYKQAGNSICVNVLEEIFKKLFKA